MRSSVRSGFYCHASLAQNRASLEKHLACRWPRSAEVCSTDTPVGMRLKQLTNYFFVGGFTALHTKSVGAVSDRDDGFRKLPRCKVALNRRRRRLLQNDFLCKAVASRRSRRRFKQKALCATYHRFARRSLRLTTLRVCRSGVLLVALRRKCEEHRLERHAPLARKILVREAVQPQLVFLAGF